jgi:hypothetical protein
LKDYLFDFVALFQQCRFLWPRARGAAAQRSRVIVYLPSRLLAAALGQLGTTIFCDLAGRRLTIMGAKAELRSTLQIAA